MTPLHNMLAEQSILGAAMLDGAPAYEKAASIIGLEDFSRADHREAWRAMAAIIASGGALDILTVSDRLKATGRDGVCDLAYLAIIAKETPSAANVESYARIVKTLARLRELADVGGRITELAQSSAHRNLADVVSEAESLLHRMADAAVDRSQGWQSYSVALSGAVDRVECANSAGTHITGLTTGYPELDDLTGGLQRADLIILAGRPSMGKTSLAQAIAEHAAAIPGAGPVAVFSLEMAATQLAMRGLSSMGRINARDLRGGNLDGDGWARMTAALNILADTRLWIDDSDGLSPAEIRARCRRLAHDHGPLALIVIDYIGLMRPDGRHQSREQEVSSISRALKGIAKEFDCPVLALSQLNRELEKRTNKRPIKSDLRDSGALEQDADLILFVYRDEVYNPESPDKGIAEIIIGKQRNGPLATVRLQFEGQYTRFGNLAPASMGADMPSWREDSYDWH